MLKLKILNSAISCIGIIACFNLIICRTSSTSNFKVVFIVTSFSKRCLTSCRAFPFEMYAYPVIRVVRTWDKLFKVLRPLLNH